MEQSYLEASFKTLLTLWNNNLNYIISKGNMIDKALQMIVLIINYGMIIVNLSITNTIHAAPRSVVTTGPNCQTRSALM